MSGCEQIKREILKRGITRLCHFTKSAKLLHILSDNTGILATDFLDVMQNDILTKNDEYRFDGHTEYISCSVQYPNTWYLDRVRNKDPLFTDWVIIFINPLIMCNDTAKFCHRNAAADRGAHIRNGFSGFQGMFAETTQGKQLFRRSASMCANCTTDGQAEVLIYQNIPRSEIIAIAVPSNEQAYVEEIRRIHIAEAPVVNWIVAPDLFNNNWFSKIRAGSIPSEHAFSQREVT